MRLVALGTPVRGVEAGGVISWQGAVKDKDLTAPPGSPSTGDRYIVASVASGAWTGEEDNIAEWMGSSWSFDTPEAGWAVWIDDESEIYVFNGSSWNQESLGPHAPTHEDGGSDEVIVEGLPTAGGAGTVVTGDGAGGLVMAMPGTPGNHGATHENGGIDEVDVAGLSGELADPQPPKTHAASHADGASDEIVAEGLATAGAVDLVPISDGAGGLTMGAPVPGAHAAAHQDGGADELSVAALAGLLADPQTPLAHLLVSAFHTAAGLTPGDVLTALSATTFGFQASAAGGVVSKVIDHTWEGNGVADRVFDLGDDYLFILIFLEEDIAENDVNMAMAYSLGECYGLFFERSSAYVSHPAGSPSDFYWQGKLFGGDANKIKGGTNGNHGRGINKTGWTYRLIGFKFSSVE